MRPCQLLVCEKSGNWAGGLRRFLSKRADLPPVHECRSLGQCLADIERWPESFVVLHVTLENVEQVVETMRVVSARFPRCRVSLVADRNFEPYQWLLREHGAVDVVFSRTALQRTVGPLRKHWATVAELPMNSRESVWERLPWKTFEAS